MASKFLRSSDIKHEDFPVVEKDKFVDCLPTYGHVIGVMRYIMEDQKTNVRLNDALKKISNMIYSKYRHDTVYCITERAIKKRVESDWTIFRVGKGRIKSGRTSGKEVDAYNNLCSKVDLLYDVSTDNPSRAEVLAKEWGVTMGDNEWRYLRDQQTERKQKCISQVDPVWSKIKKRTLVGTKRRQTWDRNRDEQFTCASHEEMTDVAGPESSSSSQTEDSQDESDVATMSSDQGRAADLGESSKKKRRFSNTSTATGNRLPPDLRHVRTSERVVRDEVYEALADLTGIGLSFTEAQKAAARMSQLWECNWKVHDEEEDCYDLDTLPHQKNMRKAFRMIEAQGMACMVKELREAKNEGRMITHATDSTTKKGIGQFAASGIHIGKNVPFPLPLIPVCGESTSDIAEQCSLMFEILAVVDNVSHEDLYEQLVDAHMTDSTEHNKGFAQLLAGMFDLDSAKGQLFCGTHTTLGFSRAMNKVLAVVERELTLEAIFSNFMVDLDFDSKHGSVGGQACDVILRLVAPEFHHKAWNYYDSFFNYLKERAAELVLFSYKDQRFGCLSRACAVILYIKHFLRDWLDDNPNVTNRLACLVRDFLDVEYLDIAFAVFASFGIQLIEPFFAATINTDATHSSLKKYYKELHDQMKNEIDNTFFTFDDDPWFTAVSSETSQNVKKSYNLDVVDAVRSVAEQNMDECIKLANLMLPELRTVLARQRRDYNLSDEFEVEYPVEDQAANPDDTPVHNLGMERLCGKTDYRAKKLKQLEAVSRSLIIDATGSLRKDCKESFRQFRKEAEIIQNLKMEWSQKMQDRFKAKLTEKQAVAMHKEENRLGILEELKESGGPFTCSEQVDAFMSERKQLEKSTVGKKAKDAIRKETAGRMKLEMKFARDSSKTLPSQMTSSEFR